MENTMEVSTPSEVQINAGAQTEIKPTEISLDPMDFQKELNKIAAEKGLEIKDGNAVPKEPKAVEQPQQASPQPAVVPEKFKAPDGSIDVAKVEKSTLHAEEALRRYEEREAELRKKQNQVHQLQTPAPNLGNQQPQQLTSEAINAALERTKNPGQVMLELQNLTYQAAYNQAMTDAQAKYEQLNARLEADKRNAELQSIANSDPWVFTQEGLDQLAKIRTQNPWMNNSPQPWQEAYDKHLATQAKAKLAGSVSIPTPTAQTVSAPATPVGATPSSQVPSLNLNKLMNDPRQLNAYLNTLTPEQQLGFWNKTIGAKKL